MELEKLLREVLDRAREDAVRRGHVEVRDEHLVLHLLALDLPEVIGTLTARGLGRVLLREAVGAVLDHDIHKLYRGHDGRGREAPPLEGTLAEAIAALPRRWLFGLAARNGMALVRLLLERPAISIYLDACRLDLGPLDRFVAAATAIASRRGRKGPSAADILVAACDEPVFAAALRALGHDPGETAPKLEALDPELGRTVRMAWRAQDAVLLANLGNRRDVDITAPIVAALRTPDGKVLVETAGVEWFEVLVAVVHGPSAELDVAESDEAEIDVVFWNDDYSTQEFVTYVLGDAFQLPHDDATRAMKTVHTRGSAVVATLRGSEARRLVARAREVARGALMPLRIELRRGVGAGQGG